MPKEILTRCGYRCDLCLAYKDNIETNDQREFLSDTWHKIYGFRIPAQEIYCKGCISYDNPKLIDNKCPVRPCVIEKGLENCSQCDEYPCDKFNQRKVVCEDLLKSKKISISKKDYSKCVKPYENKLRIDDLKKNNQPFSRLLNPFIVPNDNQILKFIERDDIKTAWKKMLKFIDKSYSFERKIFFGGKKYGWAVQYKRSKKTIITLFPERKRFTVLLIFGKSELKKITEVKKWLSPSVIKKINNTKQYHDGKWVWLQYEDNSFLDSMIELIKVKRKPENKQLKNQIYKN